MNPLRTQFREPFIELPPGAAEITVIRIAEGED